MLHISSRLQDCTVKAWLSLFCLALLLSVGAVRATAAEVELTLASGEVVGSEPGLGEASVEAKVRNNGGRALKGIRIAVYYSSRDALPPSNAEWLIHEFVFEPPLKPGGQSTLRFKDPNAAEYVALAVRRAIFEPGLSFNGEEAALASPLLLREGRAYVALRDLAGLLEARLSVDKSGWIVLEREGEAAVRLKIGVDHAQSAGVNTALDWKPIELDGRSYLALSEAARLFGLSLSEDAERALFELSRD
ncbi:hypothetical protein IT575_02280 [bacterium]|nr:hypothetical protein [bacterium]